MRVPSCVSGSTAGQFNYIPSLKRGVCAPQPAHSLPRLTQLAQEQHRPAAAPAGARTRSSVVTCASSTSSAAPGATDAAPAAEKPSAAETARTIVDLVAHGTLCTLTDEGAPLGTYVSYVLDQEGQPILRLRADAVHTANLNRSGNCSLFVQPGDYPARLLARVTLIGRVEPVDEEVAASAAELHNTLHAGGIGVDAPQPSDIYCRLLVDRCFYVGQLSGDASADVISGEEYRAAEADPLRTTAATLTQNMNQNRLEDVMRIGCKALGMAFDDMHYAELLWVDRLGAYVKAVGQDGSNETVRVPFARPVDDERGVQSALTMMAQLAWELERPYQPVAVPAGEA